MRPHCYPRVASRIEQSIPVYYLLSARCTEHTHMHTHMSSLLIRTITESTLQQLLTQYSDLLLCSTV